MARIGVGGGTHPLASISEGPGSLDWRGFLARGRWRDEAFRGMAETGLKPFILAQLHVMRLVEKSGVKATSSGV